MSNDGPEPTPSTLSPLNIGRSESMSYRVGLRLRQTQLALEAETSDFSKGLVTFAALRMIAACRVLREVLTSTEATRQWEGTLEIISQHLMQLKDNENRANELSDTVSRLLPEVEYLYQSIYEILATSQLGKPTDLGWFQIGHLAAAAQRCSREGAWHIVRYSGDNVRRPPADLFENPNRWTIINNDPHAGIGLWWVEPEGSHLKELLQLVEATFEHLFVAPNKLMWESLFVNALDATDNYFAGWVFLEVGLTTIDSKGPTPEYSDQSESLFREEHRIDSVFSVLETMSNKMRDNPTESAAESLPFLAITSVNHGQKSIPQPTAYPDNQPKIDLKRFRKLQEIKRTIDPKDSYIGNSMAILEVFEKIAEFNCLPNDPVLILGPSGAGKTEIARLIHDSSPRRDSLFSREQASDNSHKDASIWKGRWTGFGISSGISNISEKGSPGLLKSNAGGTIFVDELHRCNSEFQAFLLDVIDRQSIPLTAGVGDPVAANTRLLFGTNIPLADLADHGVQKDLRRRIGQRIIEIPSLSKRKEDLFLFVRRWCGDHDRTSGFYLCLLRYDWPYEIGELKQVIELALVKAKNEKIALCPAHLKFADSSVVAAVEMLSQKEQDRQLFEQLASVLRNQGLEKGAGLQKVIAELLGTSASTVTRRMSSTD